MYTYFGKARVYSNKDVRLQNLKKGPNDTPGVNKGKIKLKQPKIICLVCKTDNKKKIIYI